MHNALIDFMCREGFENVYIDFIPEAKNEYIVFFLWDNLPASMNDGTSTQFVQLRVMRETYEESLKVCETISNLFESGENEKLIKLNDTTTVTGRIKRNPRLFDRTDTGVVFYSEMTLWN